MSRLPVSLPAARRRIAAVLVVVVGVALLAVSLSTMFQGRGGQAAETPAGSPEGTLDRTIAAAQSKLRTNSRDPVTWAHLGSAYVEQARVTGDPSYYTKAEGALEESLRQQPDGNGFALIGMGSLANARHDFGAARDWGERAKAVLPDTAEVYGVLADAHTQLGDAEAATSSVQRMLDLKPGVSSFARAAYDLELHGRVDDARYALERALGAARDTSDLVFCHYQLGELAFNTGRLADAEQHYENGLLVAPREVSLLQGRAKVAAAHGRTGDALAIYRDIVTRVPLAQYVHEYAVLLLAAGRPDEAERQFAVLAQQEKLQAAAGAADDLTASVIAADRGDHTEALRRAEAEWARRPNVLVADALAWALHLNGRDAEALGFADRASVLGTRDATVAFHRGMILAGLGRTAEAAASLDTALRTNPYFSPVHARTAAGTLAELRSGR